MGIAKFLSLDSQSKKPLDERQVKTPTGSPGALRAGKNNVVSIIEHQFKRMNMAHDRIRSQLLSQSQNSR